MASDAFKKFDKKKIGFGKYFKAGTKGLYFGRYGLSGALKELKDPRYRAGKNLSRDDIKKFEKILGKKLKSKYKYSKGFNRYDKLELYHELEELRYKGEISSADVKDFKNIIDLLSA